MTYPAEVRSVLRESRSTLADTIRFLANTLDSHELSTRAKMFACDGISHAAALAKTVTQLRSEISKGGKPQ